MSDNGFLKRTELKSVLSRIKTRVESGIADAISDSASTLNSSITNGDSSTLTSAKNYTDGAKSTLETSIGNHTGNTNNPHNVTYIQIGAAPSAHSHIEADISDLGSYATNSDLNTYGVSSMSYDDNTSVLTLTMKDNNTKTVTITGSGSSNSVTLSDLGGASATDLSNHTGNSNNPHSVTYTQVGAAAASHTHVEADITDLGNYASSSHTHTESDITDLGSYATNSDLNTYGVSSVSYDDSTSVLTITMKGGSTKTVTITGTSGSGSSGGSSSSSSISSVSYDDTTNNLIFTMSDNSEVTCNLDNLLAQCLQYDEPVSSGGSAAVDDSLDFALIDPSSNKVYSAGISLSELNTSISGLASASHTHTKSDITDFGTYASSSHTHTESDITDLGNYSVTGHTHVKSDITDISDLATATGLNTYGVDTMSFNSSTNVLTLTMKGGDTKTVTIPSGSGNGSSGASVSTIVYDETTQKLVFTFSDNSEVECSLSDLISSFLTIAPDEDTRSYNSEWVERMTGTGTELDPYLIYTPRDFMKINEDMDAHYKLMNNLDFTPLVGIDIVPNESLNTVTLRNTFDLDPSECPLYNGGEGYRPIGYDGYYPINGAEKSTSSFDSNSPADIIYGNSTTSQYYVFTGELDGNSKFIKGIRCSPYNAYSVGLFSYLGNGASVHHLAIIDSIFMMNNVYVMQWKKSSVASLSGDITYISDNNNNRVNIHNVYSYATLISNRQTDGNGDQDVKINGIYARIHENYAPGCVCYQCAFRGKMMILNPNVRHQIAGIGHYMNYGDMDSRITNCINTCDLSGFYVQGIGQNLGKVNINCGVVSKLSPATGKSGIFSLSGHRNTGYVNGKQFSINTNLSYDEESNESSNNSNNYYFKSASNLKSRFFIIEANSLSDNDVFAYNDLGIDNGWPLLADEYTMFNSVDQSLTVGLIDSTNNQIVDSSFSIEKLNSLADFNTLVSYVDSSTSGLSPANHTHTESDITNLGSYATNSDLNTYGVSSVSYDDSTSVLTITMKDNNTKTVTITGSGSSSSSGGSSSLTLSDITDVTATSTEVNYLSGATSNIQTQISNLLNLVFPKVERSTYYGSGVRVASPLTPFIYLESLTSGYTSSSDTIKSITKVSFDPSNSFSLVDNGTDVGLSSSTVYFTPGKIFKDGSVLWFTGNLTDGHIPGEIIFKALAGTSTDGYLDLSKTSKYCLSITTYQGIVDADITGIRVVREYIDNRHWLNITANQILMMTSQSYMSMSNNAVANSKNLFKVSFTLSNQASTNELLTYIDENSLSNDNVKFLFYFAVIEIMKKYVANPKTFISTLTSILSTDISKYNTATGLSYTSSDYLGFTNALINTIITALGESGSTVSIRLEALPLYGYFVKMNKPDYLGNLENAGLPNITGDVTMDINPSQMVFMHDTSGVFTTTNSETQNKTARESSLTLTSNKTLHFDASNSNSIYGNSTTVTPQNVSLVPLMKV